MLTLLHYKFVWLDSPPPPLFQSRAGLTVNPKSQRCVWGEDREKAQTPRTHWPKLDVGERLEEGQLAACIQAFNQNRTSSVLLGIIKIGKEIPIKASNPVSDLKQISDTSVCL